MDRIDIERRGARVWLSASPSDRTSLILSDAECLADLVERMSNTPGDTDVHIGSVGLRRSGPESEISLHMESSTSRHLMTSFDVGSLARLLRQASKSRVFRGSIGIPRPQPSMPSPFDTDFSARSPAPDFMPGGSLDSFHPDQGRRRKRQVEACLPKMTGSRGEPGVPTVEWHDFVTPELKIVDALPSPTFNAIQPLWHAFDTGRWMGIEWIRNYAGHDVWRSTSRDTAVTGRQEISPETMRDLERHGLVVSDDAGLRVAAQPTYDLWRAVQMAGGMQHRDERMTTPVPLPIGFEAPGMETLSDFDTCIVEFGEHGVRLHPYEIVQDAPLNALRDDLKRMGIADSRRAELATRIGHWLYPERDAYYAGTLSNRLGGRHDARLRMRTGWDEHFLALTMLPHWQGRALARYRRSIEARSLPLVMPVHKRPDDWQKDPLLVSGAQSRMRRMFGRSRN